MNFFKNLLIVLLLSQGVAFASSDKDNNSEAETRLKFGNVTLHYDFYSLENKQYEAFHFSEGKDNNGLRNRRTEEAKLYTDGVYPTN